jgi:XTP/dITP diphosphohydrolase
MHLYVATSNPGKLRDFAYAAAEFAPIHISPLPALASIPAPPEDAPTFLANARAKALYYAAHAPNTLVLADDSGLEVDALNGAPGVRSARYAEDVGFPHPPASAHASSAHASIDTEDTDARNNAALLHALASIPTPRAAHYRCVLALARNSEILLTAEGTLEGLILTAPVGALGFGYDPLFLIPELNLTMAQLDPTTRLAHSHRARALRTLLTELPARST